MNAWYHLPVITVPPSIFARLYTGKNNKLRIAVFLGVKRNCCYWASVALAPGNGKITIEPAPARYEAATPQFRPPGLALRGPGDMNVLMPH